MRSPPGMVFAICHEVGNLLAGIRLHGELRDPGSGRRVAGLSARAGSLVSLVRPLLDADGADPRGYDPVRVLEGARASLDDPDDPRLALAARAAGELPPVRVDGEVLHHLLVSEVLASLEDLAAGERLEVGARLDGDRVVLSLVGGPPEPAPGPDERLAGRALCQVLAGELLGRTGGSVRVDAHGGRRRVALALPVA